MRNAGLDEAQAGIKTARRNINNLRYADDTTLMAESEEELKNLLKVKRESVKAGLKFNIQKTKVMASSHITTWQIDREKVDPHVRCGPVVRQIQVGDVVESAFQDYGIRRGMVRVHVEKRGGELFHVRHRHRLICRECLRRKGERGHHGNSNSFFHDFLLE